MPKGILAEFPNFSLNQPLKWLAKASVMPTALVHHPATIKVSGYNWLSNTNPHLSMDSTHHL